jgi:hypothetical protein
MCGIYVLCKAAIPQMLETTERALSAQHSSDCNATALARQPLDPAPPPLLLDSRWVT